MALPTAPSRSSSGRRALRARWIRRVGYSVAGLATLFLLSILGATAHRWATTPWEVPRQEAQQLPPWRPGLSLRQSFDSLPTPPVARKGVAAPRPGLRLLADNTEAWVERWRLLSEARGSIDVATFIVRDCVFGRAFIGMLLAKREQGLKVRLLVDGFGADLDRQLLEEDYLDELVAAGVETQVYRPLAMRLTQAVANLDPLAWIASEHDKLILVDERLAVVGGRNIGREYFSADADAPDAYHDVDVAIEDAAVTRALGRAFNGEWDSEASDPIPGEVVNLSSSREELLGAYRAMDAFLRAREGRLAEDDEAALTELELLRKEQGPLRGRLSDERADAERPLALRGEVRLLDSGPRRLDEVDPITEGLRRLLESARQTVVIETPYLVVDDTVVEAFTRAAQRGVRITIVTNSPSSSDNAMSQAFFLEQWPEILARVPTLRLYVRGDGHNLHAKTATFDDCVGVVSTYNLDPLSMRVQGEVAVVVWSAPFAALVARPALRMVDQGPPITYEYRIRRDAQGEPLRDPEGRPVVAFGPRDHVEDLDELLGFWGKVKELREAAGARPLEKP